MALHRFIGRTAIVTASTKGIGFAIAQRLAQEGARVIISSRKSVNVKDAVQKLCSEGLNVTGVVCHVANFEDRQKLFAKAKDLGGLDILVSNAAVNPDTGDVLNCPDDVWDKIFDVNLKASFLLAKEGLPLLRQSKAGRIVFVSSVAAYHCYNAIGAYGVSKTALNGLVKGAASQLASENITVNSVCPGVIDTEFGGILTRDGPNKHFVMQVIPMRRFGQPHEVSGAVAFLASDDGSYVTGENLVIAGGMPSKL